MKLRLVDRKAIRSIFRVAFTTRRMIQRHQLVAITTYIMQRKASYRARFSSEALFYPIYACRSLSVSTIPPDWRPFGAGICRSCDKLRISPFKIRLPLLRERIDVAANVLSARTKYTIVRSAFKVPEVSHNIQEALETFVTVVSGASLRLSRSSCFVLVLTTDPIVLSRT